VEYLLELYPITYVSYRYAKAVWLPGKRISNYVIYYIRAKCDGSIMCKHMMITVV